MANTFHFKNQTLGVGDTVKVSQKVKDKGKERLQNFEGIVIAIKGSGKDKAITVRRLGELQIGIERIFPLSSPTMVSLEVVKTGFRGTKRAKLYYLRSKSKKETSKIYTRTSHRQKTSPWIITWNQLALTMIKIKQILKKGLKFPPISSIKSATNRLLKKKSVRIVAVIILVISLLYAFKSLIVAAVVNRRPIFRLTLLKELEKQGAKQVLDSLITENLILQEAAKNKVTATQSEVDNEINTLDEQLKKQGMDLTTALNMQGQSRADLERNLKIKIILEKLLSAKISVSDKEIEDYFKTNQASFTKGATLEQVKDSIVGVLKQQKLTTEYQTWIKGLQENAKILYFIKY